MSIHTDSSKRAFYAKEKAFRILTTVAATFSIIAVIVICLFIFGNSIPAINQIGLGNFVFGMEWKPTAGNPSFGIFPMIVGSVYVTIGAIIIGVPIGILTAVYMAQYSKGKLYKLVSTGVNLMAGIPSIIYGFFGLVLIVPMITRLTNRSGLTMLAAIIILGIMILPTIITLTETALRAVPKAYFNGAVALGATKERAIFTVQIPAAKQGIFSAIILGIGRAIGETMAVILVAGGQARIPTSLFRGVRTMTMNIVLEMGYAAGLHREALVATGAILFIFILLINLAFVLSKRKKVK